MGNVEDHDDYLPKKTQPRLRNAALPGAVKAGNNS